MCSPEFNIVYKFLSASVKRRFLLKLSAFIVNFKLYSLTLQYYNLYSIPISNIQFKLYVFKQETTGLFLNMELQHLHPLIDLKT